MMILDDSSWGYISDCNLGKYYFYFLSKYVYFIRCYVSFLYFRELS